jgi:putative aminopeptidase FrvX
MMTSDHLTLKIFKDLLTPSPSGREWDVAAVIRQKLDEIGWPHETDPAGNVLVRVAGQHPTAGVLCFAAHMDEIAMVVTRINSDGTLRVSRSGGLMPWKLGEGPVILLGDRENLTGVLSMGSTHTAASGRQAPDWEHWWVLTGLTPGQLKSAGIRPGSYALPTAERRGPVIFGDPADPLAGAWTFDDRIGCATQLRLLSWMKQEGITPHRPLLFAFTVSEEVGGHGAKVLAQREQPEIFVSIDGSPIPPEADLALDGRPGIWSKDRLAPYDPRLIAAFMQAAEKAGTALQPVVFANAASDASLVAYGTGVPRIACIGHVRENSHGYEVIRLSVLDNLLKTLKQFISGWDG